MGKLSNRPGIPLQRTRFFGRSSETKAVREMLIRGETAIVTLTGPGGVGKTRLAAHVAAQVAAWDAVFVNLEPAHDQAAVLSAIATRLGMRDGGDMPLLDRLANVLENQEILLVLDSFEHVLESGVSVAELVDRCPRLKVLTTSRRRLRIQGEQVFYVLPLGVNESRASPAIELFVDRVRASGLSDFVPSESELEQIELLCRRLDGLPLAIELAAARVPAYSLQGLVDRLDSLLPILTEGPRDAPERLRSLGRAIGWSYDLLSEEQRRLFRWISVFQDGWSVESLLAVCGSELGCDTDLVANLAALADQSLVAVVSEPDRVPRYRMLATVREFAAEQLAASDEEQAVRAAHARTFLDLSRSAGARMLGEDRDDSHQVTHWFDRERGNVLAASDWFARQGMAEEAIEVAAAISPYNFVRGHLRDDRDRLIAALALPFDSETESRAYALVRLAIAYWGIGELETSLSYARAGQALAERAGSEVVRGIAISCQAGSAMASAHYEDAIALGEEAITIFREHGPAYELCWALNDCGYAAGIVGRPALSEALLTEGNELCRNIGLTLFLGISWCDQGVLAYEAGEWAGAARFFANSTSTLYAEGDTWYIARALTGLAGVALEWGEATFAAQMLGASETCIRHVGSYPRGMGAQLLNTVTNRLRTLMPPDEVDARMREGSQLTLSKAVELVEAFAEREIASRIDAGYHMRKPAPTLTKREVEVLTLMARRSNKEIADDLEISPRTVTTHVSRIFSKMAVTNRTEAVTEALRRGIIPLSHEDLAS